MADPDRRFGLVGWVLLAAAIGSALYAAWIDLAGRRIFG
jgi:hypothetical protein